MQTKIDPETNRISASVKDLNEDPYDSIEKKYKIGSIYSVRGVVARYGLWLHL